MVEDVDLAGDGDGGGFEGADGGDDRTWFQVVAGVAIEADDEDSPVVAAGCFDEIMQGGEVVIVASQDR